MEEILLRDPAKGWDVGVAGEKPAVDVGKDIGPARQVGAGAPGDGGVHRPEDLADDLVGVGAFPVRHLRDSGGEKALAQEDVGIFGEEAECTK